MDGWVGHSEEIDYKNGGNNALPEGVYLVKTIKTKAKLTGGGKPSTEVVWEVVSTFDGQPIGKRQVYDTLTHTSEASFKVNQILAACGGDLCPPRNGEYKNVEEFARNLFDSGREGIYAHLKQDTYEGKTKNKVKEYLSNEEAEKRAMKFAAAAQ